MLRWVNCFQNVKHCPGWSSGYCTEVMIVSVLSLLNVVLFSYLLFIDIKSVRLLDSRWYKKFFCRMKIQIFIVCLVLASIQFARNFFNPLMFTETVYYGSLNFCQLLKFVIYLLSFWFFIKRSASLVSKQIIKNFTRFLTYLIVAAVAANTVFYIEYKVMSSKKDSYKYCHNPQFLVAESI